MPECPIWPLALFFAMNHFRRLHVGVDPTSSGSIVYSTPFKIIQIQKPKAVKENNLTRNSLFANVTIVICLSVLYGLRLYKGGR